MTQEEENPGECGCPQVISKGGETLRGRGSGRLFWRPSKMQAEEGVAVWESGKRSENVLTWGGCRGGDGASRANVILRCT